VPQGGKKYVTKALCS